MKISAIQYDSKFIKYLFIAIYDRISILKGENQFKVVWFSCFCFLDMLKFRQQRT